MKQKFNKQSPLYNGFKGFIEPVNFEIACLNLSHFIMLHREHWYHSLNLTANQHLKPKCRTCISGVPKRALHYSGTVSTTTLTISYSYSIDIYLRYSVQQNMSSILVIDRKLKRFLKFIKKNFIEGATEFMTKVKD